MKRLSVFGGDHHRQLHVDVRVQMQGDRVIANRAQRAGGQPHFRARDLVPGLRGGFGDVRRADRTEELAFGAGLRGDQELELLERGGARRSLAPEFSRRNFGVLDMCYPGSGE